MVTDHLVENPPGERTEIPPSEQVDPAKTMTD